MSKGILNNRDKMIWDNTHKPEITDVVGVVDDEMDDLLEDHDDKVVDIVGDNMNDLLDAHDDKVVSIVGDNMSTLLSSSAASVRLASFNFSDLTATPAKIGVWDATHDLYAAKVSGEVGTIAEATDIVLVSYTGITTLVDVSGSIINTSGLIQLISKHTNAVYARSTTGVHINVAATMSGGTYDVLCVFAVATPTP